MASNFGEDLEKIKQVVEAQSRILGEDPKLAPKYARFLKGIENELPLKVGAFFTDMDFSYTTTVTLGPNALPHLEVTYPGDEQAKVKMRATSEDFHALYSGAVGSSTLMMRRRLAMEAPVALGIKFAPALTLLVKAYKQACIDLGVPLAKK
ncbi:MAG: SCP2 sterol-binding domain-containing protein [Chloroflexota bacterium]|nr:SCP2 sterol-binding domain-containing protein [Chloroflexota bacterium]